jgi:hypothetical protein
MLSRAALEVMMADLLAKALIPIDQALADAKLTRAQIDEVLLVGGSLLFRHFSSIWGTRAVHCPHSFFLLCHVETCARH